MTMVPSLVRPEQVNTDPLTDHVSTTSCVYTTHYLTRTCDQKKIGNQSLIILVLEKGGKKWPGRTSTRTRGEGAGGPGVKRKRLGR